jgi:hypothetical protein
MDGQDEQDKKIKHEEDLLNLDKQHISFQYFILYILSIHVIKRVRKL